MKIIRFTFISWMFLSAGISATIIHVPADQATIQAGVDISVNGDTILVASGTYTGIGNRNIDFNGKSIILLSEYGQDSTIINCGASNRGFIFQNQEDENSIVDGFTIRRGYSATYGGGIYCIGTSPKIINCKVVNCKAARGGGAIACTGSSVPIISNCIFDGDTSMNSGQSANGGAINCLNHASPIITECVFRNNYIGTSGGGCNGAAIYFGDYCNATLSNSEIHNNWSAACGGGIGCGPHSTPSITNCTFQFNWSMQGYGIYCEQYAAPRIQGCSFRNNNTLGEGAGIFLYYASAIIDDCRFASSTAGMEGGGIVFLVSSGEVRNSVFYANRAIQGAGISCHYSDSVDIISCVFDSNNAGLGGSAIYLDESSPNIINCTAVNNLSDTLTAPGSTIWCDYNSVPTVSNSIFAFNCHLTPFYCGSNSVALLFCTDVFGNRGGDWEWCIETQQDINGNLSSDPLFCNIQTHDLRIASNSPCAPQNNSCDTLIGAGEVACEPDGVDPDIDQVPRISIISNFYPNPFNSSVIINYRFFDEAGGEVDIYDIKGQLIDHVKIFGKEGQMTWDATDALGTKVSSGIYFAMASSSRGSQIIKLIYMK